MNAEPGRDDGRSGSPQLRLAGPDDAGQVAMLHADSWRRHYRGAYADSYLDGDILADRCAVWSARLAGPATGESGPATSETVLAEDGGRLVGFVHVVFDQDPRWGSIVDNLHVAHDHHRTGIGTVLLARAAQAVAERAVAERAFLERAFLEQATVEPATGAGMYLWVLEQNTPAQRFYLARGAVHVETAAVPPPGGDPARLNGSPRRFRMAWPDSRSYTP